MAALAAEHVDVIIIDSAQGDSTFQVHLASFYPPCVFLSSVVPILSSFYRPWYRYYRLSIGRGTHVRKTRGGIRESAEHVDVIIIDSAQGDSTFQVRLPSRESRGKLSPFPLERCPPRQTSRVERLKAKVEPLLT